MATKEEVSQAIGCLTVVFPQFVAKEIALLTDQIVSSVQGFTDPLQAAVDLNIDDLLEQVSSFSDGDVWDTMQNAAIGAGAYYAEREIDEMLNGQIETVVDDYHTETESNRLTSAMEFAENARTNIMLAMSIYGDLPYAAVQRMCEVMTELAELKTKNLECLRTHIVQLVNLVLVLVENRTTYRDGTLTDLNSLSAELTSVQTELRRSRVSVAGGIAYDSTAFVRAQNALARAVSILSPTTSGTSILDVGEILVAGSVESAQVSGANIATATVALPTLHHMISLEISAVAAQIDTINHYIGAIGDVVAQFTSAPTASGASTARDAIISDMQTRIDYLKANVDAARARADTRLASLEMLMWVSRIKSIQAMAQRVESLSFEVGSSQGEDRAIALNAALEQLILDLTSLSNTNTVAGVESYSNLRTQVEGLVSGSQRILDDLAAGRDTDQSMTDFHARAAAVATQQTNAVDESLQLAQDQATACNAYLSSVGDISVRGRYDSMLDTMRQMGMDRAVDFLAEGKFTSFLDSSVSDLSYIGLAINCLNNALRATDDVTARRDLITIRDELVGRQNNQLLAAADSADSGRKLTVKELTASISEVQAHAATVENILGELEKLGEELGVDVAAAATGFATLTRNVSQLDIGAGGRLSGDLESYAERRKSGVPLCFPV